MSTVTQADRDAAADCMFDGLAFPAGAQRVRDGLWDTYHLVQAFATHRTSSQVELLEALAAIAFAEDDTPIDQQSDYDRGYSLGLRDQARIARRAISNARSNSMVSGRVS